MYPVTCRNCQSSKVTVAEIGWRKHRTVGESPKGYVYKVLTKRVPTATVTCDVCGHEEHGWIDDNTLYIEEPV